MTKNFLLRDVVFEDLPIFFEFQLDPEANHMAAFTSKDSTDRQAFDAHWEKIMAAETVITKTIVFDGKVVGSVLSYETEGKPEVDYWIGRAYWGRGFATRSLADFLAQANKKTSHLRARCHGQLRLPQGTAEVRIHGHQRSQGFRQHMR